MPWVVDASPLILLGKIDRLSLLSRLEPDFIIPDVVRDEVLAGPVSDPARKWMESDCTPMRIGNFELVPAVFAWDLGAGESAVLSTCVRLTGGVAILDDLAARRCAETHRIPVKGTLGVLLEGKRRGFVDRLDPELKKLKRAGAALSARVISKALELADES